MIRPELNNRAETYAHQHRLALAEELGAGMHGIVFAALSQSTGGKVALKVFERQREYRRERDVYFRLRENEITTIRGCRVPELLRHDDERFIIEMTIVTRPFVLDFAGAYLDYPPDFSDEVIADWHVEKREQFESKWPEVLAILGVLEEYGIFMVDVNPGNISFGDTV